MIEQDLSEYLQHFYFFFPEDSLLSAVFVYGNPPPVGSVVYFSTGRLLDSKYSNKFRVKDVTYSVMVCDDKDEILRMMSRGRPRNSYCAEVYLEEVKDEG